MSLRHFYQQFVPVCMDLQLFGLLDITHHPDAGFLLLWQPCHWGTSLISSRHQWNLPLLADQGLSVAASSKGSFLPQITAWCISQGHEAPGCFILQCCHFWFLLSSHWLGKRGQRRLADTWLPQPGSSTSRFLPSITLALDIFANVDLIRAHLWR